MISKPYTKVEQVDILANHLFGVSQNWAYLNDYQQNNIAKITSFAFSICSTLDGSAMGLPNCLLTHINAQTSQTINTYKKDLSRRSLTGYVTSLLNVKFTNKYANFKDDLNYILSLSNQNYDKLFQDKNIEDYFFSKLYISLKGVADLATNQNISDLSILEDIKITLSNDKIQYLNDLLLSSLFNQLANKDNHVYLCFISYNEDKEFYISQNENYHPPAATYFEQIDRASNLHDLYNQCLLSSDNLKFASALEQTIITQSTNLSNKTPKSLKL